MTSRRDLLAAAALLAQAGTVRAQASAPEATAAKLFAIEFRTGPAWVQGKPPGEQANFREHSSNLRKLREQGILVMGARYGDKGLIIVSAESAEAARALIEVDPAVQSGLFVFELNEFSVFYGGNLQPPVRRPKT